METKDIRYFVEGLASTASGVFDELYEVLVAKGKKKMGKEDVESPEISEIIRQVKEKETVAGFLARGKKGREDLIQSVGEEVQRILSSIGVVTKMDLKRIDKRVAEIENLLAKKS